MKSPGGIHARAADTRAPWSDASALALGTGAASAEDKTFELKLSHWVPPTHPLQKAIDDWAADVEKASGGTIKYKIFPSHSSAKPSTITTWRGRHRRFYLRQSRLSARPLPDHCSRRTTVPGRRLAWRYPRDRRLVSQIRRRRDERRQVLLLLHPRPADLAFQEQEDRGADRHQGREGPAVAVDRCRMGDIAWRHQRAGQRHRSP